MNDKLYDARWVTQYFDDFGEQEWIRLVKSPDREVQLAVHNNAIRQFIKPGYRVLEIGAGAGRFTQTLAEIGTLTTVADISPVQLDLNRNNAQTYGFSDSVSDWVQVDMCDMACFNREAFDAIVCIGGPLSYVLDHRHFALVECMRVCKPGGVIIVGVMSLWGTIHQYLSGVLEYPPDQNARIMESGDLVQSNSQFAAHYCHMFRSSELKDFMVSHGLSIEFISGSNGLSAVHGDRLESIRTDPTKWSELIRMEIEACQQPGYLDAGTHLIAVGRKPG